jgi:hypothetical protein
MRLPLFLRLELYSASALARVTIAKIAGIAKIGN